MAGFTKDAGNFWLERASLMPSEDLCKKVFPHVDRWVERLENDDVTESSTAANGFLQLLIQLRVVFLQDSVIMKEKHPDHVLWKNELFRDELYLQFER